MLKEYDCWLQNRIITPEVKIPDTVYCETGSETDLQSVSQQAVKEFCHGIKRIVGFMPNTEKMSGTKENGVFLGTISDMEKLVQFLNKPSAEGFAIKVTESKIFIAGQDDAGLLYGVFRFLSLLVLGQIKNGFEICETPVSPLRIINHWDNLDGSIERGYAGKSIFFKDGFFNYDKRRIEDYARLLASVGINRISINNVNVRAQAKLLITEEYLMDLAKVAAIFRCFGIRIFLSINFASPWSLGKLPTADPNDPAVAAWWKEHVSIIYKYIPDLAGFVVKADSEGEPGPFQYKRTHADGANMLAKALAPYDGMVLWRCFVYNCTQDWRDHSVDRACASYAHFMPHDGDFDKNVILQIKFGPYDFQVREPVSPLFGALKKTRHIMELQITQEYTGHQIDLCYLPWLWEDIMSFDTAHMDKSTIRELIAPYMEGSSHIEGFAAVANVGLDDNWTGHTLAQANFYGYGRIIWDPSLTAKDIAQEWSMLSFGDTIEAEKITGLLLKSYDTYEKYTSPFGVCFMVTPHTHYGPGIEGYEFSRWGTYHRANIDAIGIDRTHIGTGYTQQYSQKNAKIFADPSACPENLILFFHRLKYDFIMKNGQTLLQNIYDRHFEAYDEVVLMLKEWEGLKDSLDKEVYESVLLRFNKQLENAREWRDQINTYFWRKTGIADKKGRKIYM